MSTATQAEPFTDSGTVDENNPWPGLVQYSEADKKFFFGRSREIEEVLNRVNRKRVSVLYAASGLVKSSLLDAGLFPRLREENYLPISVRMDFSEHSAEFTEQVLEQIRRVAKTAGAEAPNMEDDDTLWGYFHRPAADFWSKRHRLLIPVLVFDQFEEFFTLGRRDSKIENQCNEFLEELTGLAEGRAPPELRKTLDTDPSLARKYVFGDHRYKILLSLREDFLAELDSLQDQMSDLAVNRYRLHPMNGKAAMEVANQAPHLIDVPVAEEVVRFVAVAQGGTKPLDELEIEPALLSVICRELNNRRQQHGQEKITMSLLEGSETEILTDFYKRSIRGFSNEVHKFIEDQLLTVTGHRNSVALENVLTTPGLTREDIDQLENRRLLRIDSRTGHDRVELTHDRLTEVIRDSRDKRRQVEKENEAAAREQKVREKLRHSRLLTTTFLVLMLTSVGLAAWGLIERQEAQKSELAAQKSELAAEESERATVEAIKTLAAFKNAQIEEKLSAEELITAEVAALRGLQEISDKQIAELKGAIVSLGPEAVGRFPDIFGSSADEQASAARLAVDEAASNAASTGQEVAVQQVQVAQRKYYQSFKVIVQFGSSTAKTTSSDDIVSTLSEQGFVADPSRFTVFQDINTTEVLYFDEYTGEEAQLVANSLRPLFSNIRARLVPGKGARTITITIATGPN